MLSLISRRLKLTRADMEMFLDLDMPGASDDEWGDAAVLPATGAAAAAAIKHSPAATPHPHQLRPAATTPSPGSALPSPHMMANGHGGRASGAGPTPAHRVSPMADSAADAAAKRARSEAGHIPGLD